MPKWHVIISEALSLIVVFAAIAAWFLILAAKHGVL